MAGFQVTTHGRFSGDHRGFSPLNRDQLQIVVKVVNPKMASFSVNATVASDLRVNTVINT
jgi:hypothetical protein